jgi:Ca-activated chloride channel family protein
MRRWSAPLLLAATLIAGLTAGPSAFGRLALAFGWSALAVNLLEDPVWKGVALYRAGRIGEADKAFAAAGQQATFNRGNSLARLGDYALSVSYFDAVLFRDPTDEEARANRALVATLVDPVVSNGLDARGISIRDLKAKPETTDQPTPYPGHGLTAAQEMFLPVNPRFSTHSMVASRQWLATLEDEPGRYLKLRLAAERQRRIEQGTAAPLGGDPW